MGSHRGPPGTAQVWAGAEQTQWSFGRLRFVTSLPGDGKGGFACEGVLESAGTTAAALIAVGDVDNDGRLDILSGGSDLPTIAVTHRF